VYVQSVTVLKELNYLMMLDMIAKMLYTVLSHLLIFDFNNCDSEHV
jgi:hypothetical protein